MKQAARRPGGSGVAGRPQPLARARYRAPEGFPARGRLARQWGTGRAHRAFAGHREPPRADAGRLRHARARSAAARVSAGAGCPQPLACDAIRLAGAGRRRAADARRGREAKDQRRPGRRRSRRDGLPRVGALQPSRLMEERGRRPACPDGADLARPGMAGRGRRGNTPDGARANSRSPQEPDGRPFGERSLPRSTRWIATASAGRHGSLRWSPWRRRSSCRTSPSMCST